MQLGFAHEKGPVFSILAKSRLIDEALGTNYRLIWKAEGAGV
jgi:hypothetical protein